MTDAPVMACVRGCVTPGRHALGCSDCHCACHGHDPHEGCDHPTVGSQLCDPRHEGCDGCRPAPAARGILCWSDSQRLRDALGERDGTVTPDGREGPWGLTRAYRWLRDNVQPGSSVRDGMPRGTAGHQSPANDAILDICNDIERVVAEAVDHVTSLTTWRPDGRSLAAEVRFLLRHIDSLESMPLIEGLWTDLLSQPGSIIGDWPGGIMLRAHALAPWRPRETEHPGVACPICHAQGSVVTPGGEIDLWCKRCGTWIRAAQWEWWVKERQEQHSAETKEQLKEERARKRAEARERVLAETRAALHEGDPMAAQLADEAQSVAGDREATA